MASGPIQGQGSISPEGRRWLLTWLLVMAVALARPAVASESAAPEAAWRAPLGAPAADAAPGAVLVPGRGFTAPAVALGAVGEPGAPGYDARAIARWDVVPWQTFSGDFQVGVVAFHMAGIAAVAFSVDGGRWAVIRRAALNPRTGVEEYFVTLRASAFEDGPVEVRAIALPNCGLPRVLAGDPQAHRDAGSYSLELFANAKGTLDGPVRGLTPDDDLTQAIATAAEGGVLELQPGVYHLGDIPRSRETRLRWLTVRAAPGAARQSVIVRPAQRQKLSLGVGLLRFENLTMDFSTIVRIVPSRGHAIWWDRCRWFDTNGWDVRYERYSNPVHPQAWGFATGCTMHDMIYGAAGLELVRDCELFRISGDVFQNSRCVLNASVDNVDGRVLKHHSDIFQYWAPQDTHLLENRIVYNVKGTNIYAQQFFMRTRGGAVFRDFAFINIDLKSSLAYFHERPPFKSQLYGTQQHVIFRNVQTDVDMLFRQPGDALAGEGFIASDVVFEDCQVRKRTWRRLMSEPPPGVTVRGELRMRD